jgi:hypothetical protein
MATVPLPPAAAIVPEFNVSDSWHLIGDGPVGVVVVDEWQLAPAKAAKARTANAINERSSPHASTVTTPVI